MKEETSRRKQVEPSAKGVDSNASAAHKYSLIIHLYALNTLQKCLYKYV